ncbi:hypothetical protein L1785_14565 [Antribacter sp. KLBMP9083]|uniref:Uncharacterized protein n=1 Tax=Antribacter soli TaxID=2910976 RepID=A0AA41QEW5_9MICO|nr:hypothetical protein [Antribacter soli]MCF4122200.1 hypothetical protein [Antribacter soli]
MFTGSIVAESLRDDARIEVDGVHVTCVSRFRVSDPGPRQPPVWTLLEISVERPSVDPLREVLERSIRTDGGWYADFRDETEHVVVFGDRSFRYRKGDATGRRAAQEHALAHGVPPHQVDWAD